MKKVGVIMGSDSDLPVVEKCINELKKYEIPTEVHVYSAHRTPVEAIEFAQNAEKNGFGVLISAAGKAAHLGGVIAANTVLPVIEFRLRRPLWKVWMHCCLPYRCRRGFRLRPLPLTVRRMRQFWL